MAKAVLHPSLSAIRGRASTFVYRQQSGQTVSCRTRNGRTGRRGRRRRTGRGSPKPRTTPRRSSPIRCGARATAGSPWSGNVRRTRCLSANFLNPPIIDLADVDDFLGRAGDVIRVLASDPIEVVAVSLTLRSIGRGTVLESAAATRDHDVWVYRSGVSVENLRDVRVEIAAVNRAGAQETHTTALAE